MKNTVAKNNKAKSWFFVNINKIDKPLARQLREKRLKSTKLEMKKEKFWHHRNTKDHKRLLYTNKMDNLEEIDKFSEEYNIPRLNQEKIENRNRPITSTEEELCGFVC